MSLKRVTAVAEDSHWELSATESVTGENSVNIMQNTGKFTTLSEWQHTPQSSFTEKALEAEHVRLIILVKNQCRQEEIDEIKKKLADEMSEFCVTVNDVISETHHKQHASLLEADSFKRQQTHLKKSSSYKEKHMKELHNYKLGWKLHWEAMPAQVNSQWITFAATYLKEGLQNFWGHWTKTLKTWEDYVIWL